MKKEKLHGLVARVPAPDGTSSERTLAIALLAAKLDERERAGLCSRHTKGDVVMEGRRAGYKGGGGTVCVPSEKVPAGITGGSCPWHPGAEGAHETLSFHGASSHTQTRSHGGCRKEPSKVRRR